MSGNCTLFSILLVSIFFLFGGHGPERTEAQSGCQISISHWEVLSQTTRNDTIFKKVKIKIDNPNPGLMKKFFYLLDDEAYQGPGQHSSFDYQYSWEILIPIETEKITFGDLNTPNCTVSETPGFEPEICKIKMDQNIVLLNDCQSYSEFIVTDGQTIESVTWIRSGTTDTVHREMDWNPIPPGTYDIHFRSTDGCETSYSINHCTIRANAGRDNMHIYCLGEEVPLDLWSLLDPGTDPGRFQTPEGDLLDSAAMRELTFDDPATVEFKYIASVLNELPDTATLTIHVTDCSSCEYEVTSAFRSCEYPDSVELSVLPLNPEITQFEITTEDGSVRTAFPDETFLVHWPHTGKPLDFFISGQTPAGTCDTILTAGIIPETRFETDLHESETSSDDSVRISLSILSGGVAPYEVTISYGDNPDITFTLQDHETFSEVFHRSSDSVFIFMTDSRGCSDSDAYLPEQNCELPEIESIPTTCGDSNGRISLDMGELSDKCKIQWAEGDRSSTNRWNRSDLAPGTYHYTISYDDCVIRDSVEIQNSNAAFPEIKTENNCLLDGKIRFYIPDSLDVNQWIYGNESLTHFSVDLPANVPHTFIVETMDGCRKSFELSENETPWLEEITFSKPDGVQAIPGKDQQTLTNSGWYFRDEELCTSCLDYTKGPMLEEGVYGFFIEQDENCRRDTLLRIRQDERLFQIPNVLTPGKATNNRLQIFDPMQQMESVIELSVYDRYGNILYREKDTYPDDDLSFDWPRQPGENLPNVVVCVATIRCADGKEITVSQDILILR